MAEDQVVIAAGQAGETALGLIRDVRRDEDLREDLATHYTDWVFVEGSVIDGDWEEYVPEECPERVGDADSQGHASMSYSHSTPSGGWSKRSHRPNSANGVGKVTGIS